MAAYAFYPCQSDGPALSFETLELDGDASALAYAGELLIQHRTAAFVTVYCGERMVCSVPRNDPPPEQPKVMIRPSIADGGAGAP
jgi:hypothetical protein